jgi:hypothetical protein
MNPEPKCELHVTIACQVEENILALEARRATNYRSMVADTKAEGHQARSGTPI